MVTTHQASLSHSSDLTKDGRRHCAVTIRMRSRSDVRPDVMTSAAGMGGASMQWLRLLIMTAPGQIVCPLQKPLIDGEKVNHIVV